MTVDEIVEQLVGEPTDLDTARPLLPDEPGFYAWWTKPGSIPHVPPCPHPSTPNLHLFYVGISPSGPTSRQTIRKRVVGNHMRGNTGSSTFRLTLASLLFEEKGWKPIKKTDALLIREENEALSEWQRDHLRITWAARPHPWEIEHEVINRLQPPLNLAGNKSHPFAATLSAARRRFKEAARPTAPATEPLGVSPAIKARGKVTLHEEIVNILTSHGGGWMTTQQIADKVSERGLYIKRDGTSEVSAFQVHGRTKNYPDLFERDGSRVRLK